MIDVAYDDVLIRARGTNGYPPEFQQFLDTLCKRWGLNKSNFVEDFKNERYLYEKYEIYPLSERSLLQPSYHMTGTTEDGAIFRKFDREKQGHRNISDIL